MSASEISQDEVSHTNKRSEVSHTKRLPRVASNTRNDGKLLRTSNDRRLILSRNDNRDISAFSKPQYDNENEILRYAKSDNVKSQFDKTTKSTQNYIKLAQLDSAPTNTDSSDEKKMSPSFAEGDKGGGYADSRENQTFTKTSYDAQSKGDTDSSDNLQAKDLGKITAKGYKDTNAQSRQRYQSGNHIDRNLLDSSPSGNGDITSILKILPNVQYDTRQNSSSTPGEIDPANIQISGGLYYQNNFQIDGFNMNNDLDPTAGSYDNFNPVGITALPGRSQGLNIDTSLLESITVLDSNVSAAYGGFTGGVVEANTKRATKKYGANISYQISQGNANPKNFSLTNYHIYVGSNDDGLNNFLAADATGGHPQFIKHSIRASVESRFNDKAGIIASFTTTQSFIPLNSGSATYLNATLDDKRKTQKRQNYNYFLKAHYDITENFTLEASYAYAPSFSNYFIRNTKNSSFDMLTGGHQGGLKALWDNKIGHLSAQANVNYMDSSRINSAANMLGWRASVEKNWTNNLENGTVSEGGYGNVDTKQINLNVKINQNFKPLSVRFWENRISVGGDFGYVNAYYERMEDMLFGGTAWLAPLKSGESCVSGDISCSTSPVYYQGGTGANAWINNAGQYAYRLSYYKAGKIRLDSISFGFYAEDDMRFDLHKAGEINTRLGLRLDGDDYMGKVTLSPRFSLNYVLPHSKWKYGNNFATQLTFGASRYYGRNLFAFRLMEERSSLEYSLARANASKSWEEIMANEANKKANCYTQSDCFSQNKNDTNFNQLRVPYSDELMGGIMQKIYMFVISAKYIYRAGRDEIRRMCANPDGTLSTYSCTSNVAGLTSDLRFVYTNLGQSTTDVISLSIQNNGGLDFNGIRNNVLFAFDWTNVRRNYNDYNTSMDANQLNNEMIWWGGEVMRYDMRPATNFARPHTIRLNTTTSFKLGKFKWLWNNFFRWRSGYNAMASIGQRTQKWVDLKAQYPEITAAFEKYRVPYAFNWDMRIGFEVAIWRGNTLYANVDVINVLDNQNLMIASATYSATAGTTAVPVYEVGRQFWLQVGYKF